MCALGVRCSRLALLEDSAMIVVVQDVRGVVAAVEWPSG